MLIGRRCGSCLGGGESGCASAPRSRQLLRRRVPRPPSQPPRAWERSWGGRRHCWRRRPRWAAPLRWWGAAGGGRFVGASPPPPFVSGSIGGSGGAGGGARQRFAGVAAPPPPPPALVVLPPRLSVTPALLPAAVDVVPVGVRTGGPTWASAASRRFCWGGLTPPCRGRRPWLARCGRRPPPPLRSAAQPPPPVMGGRRRGEGRCPPPPTCRLCRGGGWRGGGNGGGGDAGAVRWRLPARRRLVATELPAPALQRLAATLVSLTATVEDVWAALRAAAAADAASAVQRGSSLPVGGRRRRLRMLPSRYCSKNWPTRTRSTRPPRRHGASALPSPGGVPC